MSQLQSSQNYSTNQLYQSNQNHCITYALTRETTSGQLITAVYVQDPSSDNSNVILEVPYTSQYPLAFYDQTTKTVFYTANVPDGHGDEVFSRSIETGATEQLTNAFFAINYLFKTGDSLFIGGVLRGDHEIVQPFVFSLKNGELRNVVNDEDLFVPTAMYDSDADKVYFVAYSNKKFDQVIQDDKIGVKNTVYCL